MVHMHIDYFDGIRGLLAIQSLNQNYKLASRLNLDSTIMGNLLEGSNIAATIFFVLSGRVIALHILRDPSLANFASAIIRRPFRLFIPVFVQMLVHWFLGSLNMFYTTRDNELVDSFSDVISHSLRLVFLFSSSLLTVFH